MRSYLPSNRAPFASMILLLIAAVIAGAAVGGILFAIEHFTSFYLVVAFPLVAGFIAGGVLAQVVRAGKVRSPIRAIVFGLLAGVVMYGVYHFGTYYISFRGEVRDVFAEQGEPVPTDTELDDFINTILQEEVGDTGFMGFMRLAAQEGFSITRITAPDPVPGAASSGIQIQGDIAWVYWGIEILLAAIVAAATAAGAARQPFDENSGQWFEGPEWVGAAPNKARKNLVSALSGGSYSEAGRLMTRQDIRYPRLEVTTRRSPDMASPDIMLTVNYAQRKGRLNAIKSGIVTASELETLSRAMAAADQQAPAAPTGRR